MDGDALTAAHRTLPLGTTVRVANLDNGRAVVVRINDRGPFAKDRIIDLSKAAAARLGMIADGVATVRVTPVEGEVASNSGAGVVGCGRAFVFTPQTQLVIAGLDPAIQCGRCGALRIGCPDQVRA